MFSIILLYELHFTRFTGCFERSEKQPVNRVNDFSELTNIYYLIL